MEHPTRETPLSTPPTQRRETRVAATLRSADFQQHGALDMVMPLVIDELRQIARRQLAKERDRFTLQTTDLVHEAYLRLIGDAGVTAQGRAYFCAAAARAMRQILVDAARRRNTLKRGEGVAPLSLEADAGSVDAFGLELLDLDQALGALEQLDPRAARIIECRFFAGMTVDDTALALGCSPRTVKSGWALARAWLYNTLRGADA